MTHSYSLRWKLTGLIVGGSVMTGIIAAAGFSWWDLKRFWERTSAEQSALATIVADQVGPALLLGDRKAAGEILGSLGRDSRIQKAVLYDKGQSCFAEFQREPGAVCPPCPPQGVHRDNDLLLTAQHITVAGERQGTLLLAGSIPSIQANLRQYARGAGLIVLLSLIVAAVLAVVLQATVSGPVLAIAGVARQMAETRRFEQRVSVMSKDEVGVLAGSFNLMLDEIARRDEELAVQRGQLEEQVVERSRVNEELREAKEKAEGAARVKSEFLANMSHEIRTPLNGVLGMITLVLDGCTDPEARDQLQAAQNAAQSLNGILNEILDLSKIEAGKMTLETITFDVHTLVQDCAKIFILAAREKNLRLEVQIEPGCPAWVKGDPVRLRQILINLMGNAIKFTTAGEVRLAVAPGIGDALRFEVSDTGIGIPKEKLQSIFEAFTQADGSHTRRFGGSGLGLAITRRLISLMGGDIVVESEVGKGTRFQVELPLPVSRPAAAPAATAAPSSAGLPALRILVAEDNAVNQAVIKGMLLRQGWTVALASNGAQAYERFLEKTFDLILMDVQMPEVDGLEATALIRADEKRRELNRTPIIAFTAHAAGTQHEECLASGMDGVITKPVDLTTLLTVVINTVRANPHFREVSSSREEPVTAA